MQEKCLRKTGECAYNLTCSIRFPLRRRCITERYVLSGKHLVYCLGTRKRMMIQNDLYSRFSEHVETIYLAI